MIYDRKRRRVSTRGHLEQTRKSLQKYLKKPKEQVKWGMEGKLDNQGTFFDMALQQRGCANKVLETIAREVDFREAEERVASTYKEGGRPGCRVGVLLRIMILQHLYGLSDPQAEEQVKDRLSFQKFLGLGAEEGVPDETTICRFRQRLIECGLHEELLGLLNGQLESRGYFVKQTTLVDATIVQSSRQRPARCCEGADADASFTRVRGQTHYGYKAHVSADGAHQLIRTALISTAKVCEGHVLQQITPTDTAAVYADKGYDTKANRAWLKQHGIVDGILKKGARCIRLTAEDIQRNKQKGFVRRHIERVFAQMKQWQRYRRVRYLGLIKNQLELTLKAVAYNLKRFVKLLELQPA